MLGGTLTAGTQTAHHTNLTGGKSKPSVLVVGAGLIGSSVAMHLARQGCKVTVVEASQPASGECINLVVCKSKQVKVQLCLSNTASLNPL